MAPALNHPTGVTFVDDHDVHRPGHVEAETYYGGGESYTRSRTYSHVRVIPEHRCSVPHFLIAPLVSSPRVQPQEGTCLPGRLASETATHVARREERYGTSSFSH